MIIQADENIIYELIKKAVNDAVDEKFAELKLNLIPPANVDDIDEINEIFGNPDKYQNQEFEKADF